MPSSTLRRARTALLASVALFAGCATSPRAPGEVWTSGRISVHIEATADRPAQSLSAAFELRGSSHSGELRLNTPLGLRMASARWAPGLAVLVGSDGERSFDDLDALSRVALGEALPLAALPDWLAGRPWPDAGYDAIEGGFEQLGWQVHVARRAEGWVEAHRAAPPAVQVRVRLDGADA